MISNKPWSVADFELNRPDLTKFIKDCISPLIEDHACRRIVIRAPVKSGKREMVEYAAMRDKMNSPKRVHVFLSAWHRKADEDQRHELSEHNMRVFSITTTINTCEFLKWARDMIEKDKQIIAHVDECDYGSGDKQILSRVWSFLHDNKKITSILYSATPEEVIYSSEVVDEFINDIINNGKSIRYTPPQGFCGPEEFLQDDLIENAKPFFEKTSTGYVLSQQGKDIIKNLKINMITEPDRCIIVLRLSYSELGGKAADKRKNKAIHQFLSNIDTFPELEDFDIIADKDDDCKYKSERITIQKIDWSNYKYWDRMKNQPRLIIIDQTSSRSTEWACHNHIYATHDFRNVITFSTVSQAQERVNHYANKYGGFQPIKVYGHKNTFELSAGHINHDTYLNSPDAWYRKKVDKRTSGNIDVYHIKNNITNDIHPLYKQPVSKDEADRILQNIGCIIPTLSIRVAGSISSKPIFQSVWRSANIDTWGKTMEQWKTDPENETHIIDSLRKKNPFIKAKSYQLPNGDWQGFRRIWSKFNYDVDIKNKEGWGVTENTPRQIICYKDGNLGIAITWIKCMKQTNSLTSVNSMYRSN